MSRERAMRRAERERARAETTARQERRSARIRRRRARVEAVRDRVPRRTRWRRQTGLLARRRRLQNSAVAGLFLLAMVLLFSFTDSWQARAFGVVVALLALPVLVTLVFDRRS